MQVLEKTIQLIRPIDENYKKKAYERLDNQARPNGSLGKLEHISAQLSGIYKKIDIHLENKMVVVCAGDHGICNAGVSLFPSDVTPQMVLNFVQGGASINVLAKDAGASVRVADLGVNYSFDPDLPIFHKKIAHGTQDFSKVHAMTRDQAIASIEAGIEIVDELVNEKPVHILGTGDMGIGNTTPSTAIIACYSVIPVQNLTGRGTGIDDQALSQKVKIIENSLALHQPDPKDPIDVLQKVGGFEIGGLCGLVLGAARHGIPIICDGLISTAGAMLAYELCNTCRDYLFASHESVEVGHQYMLKHLNLEPLLQLDFRLGEGTGAALCMKVMDAATRVLAEIKTFEEVGIANAQKG
ncbi:nicotinate-nucleotide--dimethylbenzimidazole phosphoribosyltransferase [Candidatus Magnetomorum sp. HK-1]|nr:nicotinate-nucleotide--dimethylbenzimidazole phosphoribosyltransferase [Candidatus Magnetomorum sp. HK-1]